MPTAPGKTKPRTPRVPRTPGGPLAPTNTPAPLAPSSPGGSWSPGSAPQKSVVRDVPKFDPAQYLAQDLMTASSSLQETSEADHQQYLQTIAGQSRTVDIVAANLGLNLKILKAEGMSIDCEIAATNNAAKAQDLTTAQIKHEQAFTRSGIEHAKLGALQHDLHGYGAETALKGQTWQLKLTSLATDLHQAHSMLQQKHDAITGMLGNKGSALPPLPTIDTSVINRQQQAA